MLSVRKGGTVTRKFMSLWIILTLYPGVVEGNELPGVSVRPDVVYGHKDGLALTYDIFTPTSASNGRGLLFMVSGGWVSRWAPAEQMISFFNPLLEAGYTVFAVRHGSSPKYLIPEITSDVRLALQHINDNADAYAIDRTRLGAFGFSAGGHLSLMLGTTTNQRAKENNAIKQPSVAAVAAVFPPTDLAPYMAPGNPLQEQFPALKFPIAETTQYSPLKLVSSDDAPTLLVHGDKDDLVPVWHSEKIHQAFEKSGVPSKLIIIEGAGHGFDAMGTEVMFNGILEWFETHLK